MANPSGYVIYRGPSMLDGAPIVAILTTSTQNRKTGNMCQTWILPDNGTGPHFNVRSGADVSVCGDCPQRPSLGGSCYVNTAQGPRAVYAKYLRGGYELNDGYKAANAVYGRALRIGSYGDPAAVPLEIWERLVRNANMHTGYTHQWRRAEFQGFASILMASCDTAAERTLARAMGWRTFTIRLESDPLAVRESACPASPEGGERLDCAKCGACNGAGSGRKGSIAIVVHGSTASRYRVFRLAQAIR
jgi:hypothetical protein